MSDGLGDDNSRRRWSDGFRLHMHKLATYWHGWRQGRHVEQFGVKQLRVLTITTSARRIETMLDALHDVTGGKGSELFLFLEDDALRETNPLDAMWRNERERLA